MSVGAYDIDYITNGYNGDGIRDREKWHRDLVVGLRNLEMLL